MSVSQWFRSRRSSRLRRAGTSACLLFLSLSVGTSFAQVVDARLNGTVTDASGAVLPGAAVRLQNADTGVVAFAGLTDNEGHYRALHVLPGRYALTVTLFGFRSAKIEDVLANVDQGITLDVSLQPGEAKDSVTVSSDTQPSLNQSDATLATLITPSQVQDLPLPNRDITSTFLLVPGAAQGSNTNSQNNNQLSFNGSRTLGTNPLLDGTSVITASTGGIDTLPSPDALSEVKIIASTSSAEYGRTSGATVLFTTRSGTNTLHGGLYNLLRNEDLNANSFSNKINNLPRNRDRFLQYGGTLGGPILLPHLYDGRNRSFFFFNYDRTQSSNPSVVTQSVPGTGSIPTTTCGAGSGFRGGDFSSATTLVYDPRTKLPFPGNIIPCGRIDQAAARINALLPLPNSTGTPDPTNSRSINNYVSPQSLNNTTTRYTGRLDETLRSRMQLLGSVNHYLVNAPATVVFNPLLNQNSTGQQTTGWESSVGATESLRPTLIVQFHMGFYRSSITSAPTSLGVDVANTFGIATSSAAETPSIQVGGYGNIGPNINTTIIQLNQTVSQDASLMTVLGRHTVKAGEQVRRNQFNRLSPTSYNNGQYVFDGSVTSQTSSTGSAVNAEADYLLGAVKTAQYELPQPKAGRRNYNLAFFAQDDWSITSRLTLNLGLRQEYESPLTVNNNVYSRFDPSTGALLVAGLNSDRTLNTPTPKINLGPHAGFAYTPHAGLVIRGGYSIAYGNIFSNLGSQVNSPGFDVVTNFNNLGSGVAQPFTLSQGMPLIGVQNLQNPAAGLGTGSPSAPLSAGGPEFFSLRKLSSMQQTSIGLQQDMTHDIVLEMNYVHSHGVDLPLLITLNQPQTIDASGNLNVALANHLAQINTTVATQNARPFPNLGQIAGQGNYAGAHYDALQASLRRQFTSSIAFLANYTWSRAIDDSSGIYSFSAPSGVNGLVPYSSVLRRRYDVGLGELDQRHTFSLAFQLTTHGNRVVRGFRLAGIFVGHTGLPQTVTESGAVFPGATSQRPNGNASLVKLPAPYHSGNTIQYYRPVSDAQFPFKPVGPYYATINGVSTQILSAALGNSGRSTTSQPGEETLNLSGSRTFVLHDGISLQLRIDALNALNHTNLSGPSTTLTVATAPAVAGAAPQAIFNSAGFGQIGTAYTARALQLLTRISF